MSDYFQPLLVKAESRKKFLPRKLRKKYCESLSILKDLAVSVKFTSKRLVEISDLLFLFFNLQRFSNFSEKSVIGVLTYYISSCHDNYVPLSSIADHLKIDPRHLARKQEEILNKIGLTRLGKHVVTNSRVIGGMKQ